MDEKRLPVSKAVDLMIGKMIMDVEITDLPIAAGKKLEITVADNNTGEMQKLSFTIL